MLKPPAGVTTFEVVAEHVNKIAEHDSMREASAQLPEGAYTTFRTYNGNRILRLNQHLRRLEESVVLMGKTNERIDAAARRAMSDAIRDTHYPESRFRLTYAPPRFFVSVEPFTPLPHSLYEAGAWCVTVSLQRDTPHAKSTTFIASAADAYRALPEGANEGLMIAEDGAVLEGLSSNFFALLPSRMGGVKDGELTLHTEEARALIGVTRSLVIEVAQSAPGVPISTRAVTCNDLPQVRECFITSVSREILPVVKIDGLVIGDGKPGQVTRELMRRFRDLVAREAEPLL